MAFVGGPLGACRWVVGVGEAVDPAVCATCTKRPTGAQNPRPAAIYMGEGEPQFKIKNRAANNAWEVGYKAYLGRRYAFGRFLKLVSPRRSANRSKPVLFVQSVPVILTYPCR